MPLKRFKSCVTITLFLCGTALFAPGIASASTVLIERIVARVNNEIITQRQYDAQAKNLHEQLAQKYSGTQLQDEFNKHLKNLLRDMIDRDLLVEKAQDDNIDVTDQVLLRLDQIRRRYGVSSLRALRQLIESQGLNWVDFKNQIKRGLLMQHVIEREVGSDIIISQAQARTYFEAHKQQFQQPAGVHLAEILVSTQSHTPAEAKKIAGEALAALNQGKQWPNVTAQYSDDPSAADGGDIGFFKKGTIVPAIADAVANLNPGQHSGIVKTRYGYVIIQLIDRSTGGVPTFDNVEQQVQGYLYNQQMEDHLRSFLYKLRKESFIRLAPGFIDTGEEPPIEIASKKRGR